MTDQEIAPYVGKAVRATLADGRMLAGTLHADDAGDHGHAHYAIVSDPIREVGAKVREILHGGDAFTQIEEAAGDPAAVE